MRKKTPVEIQIETAAAGYARSVEVVRYTDNGDGSERRKSLALFTKRFEDDVSAEQWQAETTRGISNAITDAVRELTLRQMNKPVRNKPLRFRDPQSPGSTHAAKGDGQ